MGKKAAKELHAKQQHYARKLTSRQTRPMPGSYISKAKKKKPKRVRPTRVSGRGGTAVYIGHGISKMFPKNK